MQAMTARYLRVSKGRGLSWGAMMTAGRVVVEEVQELRGCGDGVGGGRRGGDRGGRGRGVCGGTWTQEGPSKTRRMTEEERRWNEGMSRQRWRKRKRC